MKWFKHMSNTLDNPKIQDLLDKWGAKGYLWYFGTLEFLAKEDALHSPVEVSIKFLARKFRTQPIPLLKFYASLNPVKNDKSLEIYEKFPRNFQEISALLINSVDLKTGIITIFCPKLQQIKDNYRTDLEVSTKTLGTNYTIEKEKEKEKDIYVNRVDLTDFDGYAKEWNNSGYPRVTLPLSDPRKEKLKARLKDPLYIFKDIIAQARNSNDFIQKYITFDWITKNDTNWRKIMEGNYAKQSGRVTIDKKEGIFDTDYKKIYGISYSAQDFSVLYSIYKKEGEEKLKEALEKIK